MNIERHSIIKPDTLSPEHYLTSLLEQASKSSLLPDGAAEILRLDCLALLSKKALLFTGMDSSSVPVETAQALLESVTFTIGVQLKTFPCPDDALAALLTDGVTRLYEQGRQRIDLLLSEARLLHTALTQELFSSPNEFYSATVIGGIGGFFKLYRPDYTAQEIHITADYPTLLPVSGLQGIEFILRYLQCLYLENSFLTCFNPNEVHRLLLVGERSYAALPLNLCEPVLICALGCILTGCEPRRLKLSPAELSALERRLTGKKSAEIQGIYRAALLELAPELELPDALTGYLTAALPSLAAYTENVAKLGRQGLIFTAR